MILCIESSGEKGSVAIQKGGSIFFKESQGVNQHAEMLLPMIHALLEEAHIDKKELTALALSVGPGSYTGLRIGSAAAKSICMALQLPLIGISTLNLLAIEIKEKANLPTLGETLFVPMLDARRMEVYTRVYSQNLEELTDETAHIISQQTPAIWHYRPVCIGGSGASKCYEFLKDHLLNITYLKDVNPHAQYMVELAESKFLANDFLDIVNFEPSYLKPFYTTAQPYNPTL